MTPVEKDQIIDRARLDLASLISSCQTTYSRGYDGPRPISQNCVKAADAILANYPCMIHALFPEPEIEQMAKEVKTAKNAADISRWEMTRLKKEVEELRLRTQYASLARWSVAVLVLVLIVSVIWMFV